MSVRTAPILCVMALWTATSLSAHHSTVAYSLQSIVLKNTTITKVVWAHPHIVLTFTVKDTNGAASTWSTESCNGCSAGSPPRGLFTMICPAPAWRTRSTQILAAWS